MSEENKKEEIKQQNSEEVKENAGANTDPGTAAPAENKNSEAEKDPGVVFTEENAHHTGEDFEEDMKSAGIPGHVIMIIAACLVIAIALWFYFAKRPEKPTEEPTGGATTQEQAAEEPAETAETAGTGAAEEEKAVLSPEMEALEKALREELSEKDGDWALYLYRLDTDEEFGINAETPMVSASLIKLYIAGCYLEQVEKGNVEDNYQDQLFLMLSESNNEATNQLIDLLGKDEVNAFIKAHDFKAGQLNRKMLEANGTENYTSAEDCGHVLRSVYKGEYVNKEASERILDALRAQIARNRYKIPAGVPEGVETANKTGELFIKNDEGVTVAIQNDAAIIFAEGHPYVLTVMTAVPRVGEEEMHIQIADISREVYAAICGEPEDVSEGSTEAEQADEGATEAEQAASEGSTEAEQAASEGSTEAEQAADEGSTETEQARAGSTEE